MTGIEADMREFELFRRELEDAMNDLSEPAFFDVGFINGHGGERLIEYKHVHGGSSIVKRSNPITVLEAAILNEYGSQSLGIPERPFMRSFADRNAHRYYDMIEDKIRSGMPIKLAVQSVANIARGEMEEMIQRNETGMTPNAPSTIRRKGGKPVLLDTGVLVSSIAVAESDGD